MALPEPLAIGTELWSVAPYTDDDTGIELWEPVKTKVHWLETVDGILFINDCIASQFFTTGADAYVRCDELNEDNL